MRKVFHFFTPTRTLLIFILFIISVGCIYQIDPYKYKKIRVGLIFLYFIPTLFMFMLVFIYNLKKSIKESNLNNKIISIIPLICTILYFLYIFFMVLFSVIFH
ncbi:hypothetical protein ACM46_22645 [Chryseobacterium angstadtii]|uniref:Lipoprotein n=1 Tax=Chryseobacterium angstadtii TaxID=558151 RepID=A0A0J7KMF5_9FLAO|nr:hypothetical protein ACM46_22645 [Chryseobacterium angstadtii]